MIGTLTLAQQATLDYHLRETNRLTNEELILELTDHYTTALIKRTAQGESFNTALSAIQAEFGGRASLQRMERQYNQVTFRHYDEQWKENVLAQFKQPTLWRQTIPAYLVLLGLSCAFFLTEPVTDSSPKWTASQKGILAGFILGLIPLFLYLLGPYLKAVVRNGLHNVPTEALYLLKRQLPFTLILGGIGIMGTHWLLPIFIAPIQAILVSLYLAAFGLYMTTAHFMQELLYDFAPSH